jgi:hypothetical protein
MPKYIPTEGSGSKTKKKIDLVTEHQKYQLVVKLAPVRMLDANLIQELQSISELILSQYSSWGFYHYKSLIK